MCLNIEVVLPTVRNFLLLYPLSNGCLLIFVWTVIRTLFSVVLFSTAILEVLIGRPFPFGTFLMFQNSPVEYFYLLYYLYVIMLLNEFTLFVYSINLAIGVCEEIPYLIKQYLIVRSVAWFVEMFMLPVLCIIHKPLIGWYLGILLFVVLDFYAFIIVYSYYSCLTEDNEACEK